MKKTRYLNLRNDILELLKSGESYGLKLAKELYKQDKYKNRSSEYSLYVSVLNTLREMRKENPKIVNVKEEKGINRTSTKGKKIYNLVK